MDVFFGAGKVEGVTPLRSLRPFALAQHDKLHKVLRIRDRTFTSHLRKQVVALAQQSTRRIHVTLETFDAALAQRFVGGCFALPQRGANVRRSVAPVIVYVLT